MELDYTVAEALEELGFCISANCKLATLVAKIKINVVAANEAGTEYEIQIFLPNGRVLACWGSLKELLEG